AEGDPSGGTRQEKITRQQINNDLILNLSGVPLGSGLTLSGLVGSNVNMRENSSLTGTGDNLEITSYYNLNNFEDTNVSGTLPEMGRLVGVYSQATIDYSDWAFLTLTARNDWSSTLPKENNSYFYPSASLGIVFTDALNLQSSLLQYGKLRIS